MPRIYTSEGDALDFCKKCFPKEEQAKTKYNKDLGTHRLQENRYGYDDSHPDYEGEGYTCEKCGKELKGGDN